MAVRVDRAVTVNAWQEFMLAVYPGCTFHDYQTTFLSARTREIAPRLVEILSEFGEHGHSAIFALCQCAIVGFWASTHHNYIAIKFSKASGDEFDGFTVNSIVETKSRWLMPSWHTRFRGSHYSRESPL